METGVVANSRTIGFLGNGTMFLIAGLMGVLAVGATALVGLEIASDNDPEDDSPEEMAGAGDAEGAAPYDLVEIAANLIEALPETDTEPDTGAPAMIAGAAPLADMPDADAPVHDGPSPDGDSAHEDVHEDLTAIDFLAGLHQDQVSDFVPEEDTLVIIYDDLVDPDPTVGLEADEDDPSRSHVTLNGARVAAVDDAEGLTLDHVTLVPQSTFDSAAAA